MDIASGLLLAIMAGWVLRLRYQRAHIALLSRHLANFQIERHLETLTEGYTRAIHEDSESRQLQVLESFLPTERSVAAQCQALSDAMQKEDDAATTMGALSFYLPMAADWLPGTPRDFRQLLRIHAAGLRHVVENEAGGSAKDRAFHLSAELYLLQHSCHWFCKSRAVADARLAIRHQVTHQKVLDSVSDQTRHAYLRWRDGGDGH